MTILARHGATLRRLAPVVASRAPVVHPHPGRVVVRGVA